MDLVDPAGTLQSGMSPTLATEDDEDGKTSFPLSRDDLENYLRALDKPALKSFLQRSKI